MKAAKIPVELLKRAGVWLLKNASWIVPSVVGAVRNTMKLLKKKPSNINLNPQHNEKNV
jgi:hypothetical protein